MPSLTRKLPFVGIAFVLALLLSAYTLTPSWTSAHTVQASTPTTSGVVHFTQIVYSSNQSGDSTIINNTAINNKPDGILFVTPNWNPGGVGGTYNNHNVGVWYNTGSGAWAVFNEDKVSMPLQATFNILAFAS